MATNWQSRDFSERLGEVIQRTIPLVGPGVANQLKALLEPESLALMAGILAAWIASHAFGIGEIIDIILLVSGVIFIGLAVFDGVDHFIDFAFTTHKARTSADLDKAARHLAQAISILGVTTVLALLFRGRPRTYKGPKPKIGPPPPKTPGIRYKPTSKPNVTLKPGHGSTSMWGDVVYSSQGSKATQALVRIHERVHQILTPKLYPLRNFRVSNRASSHVKSSLRRYLEEALAETIAQVGVNGAKGVLEGIRFPVSNGYVTLLRQGTTAGVLTELGGLLGTAMAGGLVFKVYFKEGGRVQNPSAQTR
jgi:hypothetical protein